MTVTGTGDLAASLIRALAADGVQSGHSLLGFHARHPPVMTLLTLVGYTLVFAVAAVRYFRWE